MRENISILRKQALSSYFNKRWKLLDFYEGRQDKDEYLKNHGFQNIKRPLPLGFVNLTKKIIDKTSLVYKYPPRRNISKSDDKFQDFLRDNPSFDFSLQKAEQMTNLFGNILFRPWYTKRGYTWWIDTEWIPHYEEGDPFNPVAYSIPIKQDVNETDPNKVNDNWYMYWSDEEYYWYVPGTSKRKADPSGLYEDMKNPLGVMPIVEMRKDLSVEEYWLDGAIDLVMANQNININWNSLNYAIHYQSFDQPYITGIDDNARLEVERDHTKLWRAPEGTSYGILGFNPKLMETTEAIKAQMQIISSTYHVSLDWIDQAQPASGFALIVRNMDLLEEREKAVQRYRVYEKKIYEVHQALSMFKGAVELPEADLSVDFEEIHFPLERAEEREDLEFKYKWNLSTPLETLKADNPDMDEKQLLEKYEYNKKINQRLTPAQQEFRTAIEEEGGEFGV